MSSQSIQSIYQAMPMPAASKLLYSKYENPMISRVLAPTSSKSGRYFYRFLRVVACSLIFSSQVDIDLASYNAESLSKLRTSNLGSDSKHLIGWESLSDLWAGQPKPRHLHVFVASPRTY
jgi:hypothetical protein